MPEQETQHGDVNLLRKTSAAQNALQTDFEDAGSSINDKDERYLVRIVDAQLQHSASFSIR
jgi:hypothetical protein